VLCDMLGQSRPGEAARGGWQGGRHGEGTGGGRLGDGQGQWMQALHVHRVLA
jgi:hypothetical protein